MNVISRPAIRKAQQRHADAADWLDSWWAKAGKARWTSLADVRADYSAADQVGGCLVFDVKGNDYRLICGVTYAQDGKGGTLFVKHFLTHAEYNKNRWKDDCE